MLLVKQFNLIEERQKLKNIDIHFLEKYLNYINFFKILLLNFLSIIY